MPGFKKLLGFIFKKTCLRRQEKALVLVALVLVSAGVLLPQLVLGATASTGSIFNLLNPFRYVVIFFLVFITAPAMLFTWVMKMLADVSYLLLIYVVNQMVRDPQGIWAITRASANGAGGAFLAAWNIMKDYANMAIVLGLIAIAAATILHIREEYRAKKLLVPLIIVALLVNFSVVFVGLMIDGSNLIMKGFLVGAEQEGDLVIYLNRAYNNIADPLYTRAMAAVLSTEDITSLVGTALTYSATEAFFGALYFLVAITFFLLTLVFIERYIMLAILFIFSPLAFVLWVFPFSRGQFSLWWTHFLKWCFAGIVAAFFLRISVKVLAVMPAINWSTTQGQTIPRVMPRIIMQLLVVLGFVFAGYKLSKKSSIVANKVIDGVKAIKDRVVGAGVAVVTGGAAGALKIASAQMPTFRDRLTQARDYVRNTTTRVGEGLGIYTQGTAKGEDKKAHEERLKKFDSLENIKDNSQLAERHQSSTNPYEKAKIVDVLAKRNALDAFKNKTYRDNAVKEATDRGVGADDVAKADADYATLSKSKVGEAKRRILDSGRINPSTRVAYTATEAEAEAKKQVVREAAARMKVEDLDHLSDTDVANGAQENTSKGMQYRQEAIKRKILSMVGNPARVIGLLKSDKETYGANIRNAKKLNANYVEADEEAIDKKGREIASGAGVPFDPLVHVPAAKVQLRKETYKGLDAKEIKDMEKEAFTEEFVDNTTAQKIKKAGEFGLSAEKITELNRIKRLLVLRRNALRALPPPLSRAQKDELERLNAKIKAIKAL